MGSVLNKNSMRISRNPEFFVSGLMEPGKKKPPGIADLSFFDQITGKYRHAAGFIKTSLYFLCFPEQVKFFQKNLLINFFIHSHFRIRPKINLHFQVSRRSHDKALGGRIASYLTDEQRSHAGWIGASKYEVIFERALRFKLLSQPVLHFQNIALRAVKKLSEITHKNTKVQKHEIRPGNQVANIFFRDTSFFTYLRLNPISNYTDRNIVEKKSKSMQNLVVSEVTGAEKNNIHTSHPSRRPFLVNAYLQKPRNKITIPLVLLNVPVRGHIFAKLGAAGRQVRSDWINHISPTSESDTGILFVSDFLRDGQKRLKFSKKQSDQRFRRHGGMELATLPYTGVSSRIKSFARPGSIKFSPAVLPFLQMEISNKSNIEHKMFTFPEKDLASCYMARSRTHHITTTANLFRHADVHTRVKSFLKSYFTEFPVTSVSRRRELFNFYNNVTNEKQSNISQETIARPVSLIPFDRTAGLMADLPSLPPVFSNSPLMHENSLLKAKDAGSHPKERARKQPIESDTAHLNIIKNINFNKKSIKRTKYIPFLNYNFTYMMKQRHMLRKSGSVKTINNPDNSPDMTYFFSNRSPHSTDMAERSEERKKTEFLKVDSSYKTDHTKLLSVPGPDLYGLADKVYGLIVERIKRERELRGR